VQLDSSKDDVLNLEGFDTDKGVVSRRTTLVCRVSTNKIMNKYIEQVTTNYVQIAHNDLFKNQPLDDAIDNKNHIGIL